MVYTDFTLEMISSVVTSSLCSWCANKKRKHDVSKRKSSLQDKSTRDLNKMKTAVKGIWEVLFCKAEYDFLITASGKWKHRDFTHPLSPSCTRAHRHTHTRWTHTCRDKNYEWKMSVNAKSVGLSVFHFSSIKVRSMLHTMSWSSPSLPSSPWAGWPSSSSSSTRSFFHFSPVTGCNSMVTWATSLCFSSRPW